MDKEQETRTVSLELTFQKAKRWFNKGGELKTIALQAFTKKELTQKAIAKNEVKTITEQSTQEPVNECHGTPNPIGKQVSVQELKTSAYIIGADENETANVFISQKLSICGQFRCSWQDAMNFDRTLPGGWHIPTDDELESFYDVLTAIGIDPNNMWTINERNGIIAKTTGEQKYVRAIFFK